MDDIFQGHGIPVNLPHKYTSAEYEAFDVDQRKEANKDAFLKIRETLTRIGVASRREKNLYQTAHILHKRGNYAILHFKELFSLDGKPTNIDAEDIARRNRIVQLLQEWELLTPKNSLDGEALAPLGHIKIVKHAEKSEWKLVPKYSVGSKKSITSRG